MATISLRMISFSRVKGARHQSIPAITRLSTCFLKPHVLLGINHVCLLSSDPFYKFTPKKIKARAHCAGPCERAEKANVDTDLVGNLLWRRRNAREGSSQIIGNLIKLLIGSDGASCGHILNDAIPFLRAKVLVGRDVR